MKFNEQELRQKLIKAEVPVERHDEAIASLRKGYDGYQKKKPFNWKAPFVMFWLLYLTDKVKPEDNFLPAKYWKYDNNISMNGDAWGMILKDGTHVSYHSWDMLNSGEAVAIQYTDPEYKGDTYYCKGHGPRTRRARFAWLGLRNKASGYAMSLGDLINPTVDSESFGHPPEKGYHTLQFLVNNGVWQMREQKPVLFNTFDLGYNLGMKVNNATVTHPRASVTWGHTLRRFKKGEL